MALEVIQKDGKISAVPVWQSGDMIMPDPPVVANGVLYATQTGGQAMQNFLEARRPPHAHSRKATPCAPRRSAICASSPSTR